jgi:hypothetical protein
VNVLRDLWGNFIGGETIQNIGKRAVDVLSSQGIGILTNLLGSALRGTGSAVDGAIGSVGDLFGGNSPSGASAPTPPAPNISQEPRPSFLGVLEAEKNAPG